MATTKNIPDDLIPMRAGIVRVIPLDDMGRKLYNLAVTTRRDFLSSTQHTITRTSETVENGNGQDAERPTAETHNIAVATNVYDPNFHATVGGKNKVTTARAIMHDISITPVAGTGNAEFTFTTESEYPAQTEDKKYHFEIRDAYGNALEQGDSASAGTFKYTESAHKLEFESSLVGAQLTCIYYINVTDTEAYEAAPVLKTQTFALEIRGEMQSIKSGEHVLYYAEMPRAAISGDLPAVTTQKPLTNTITYNFKSMPVPQGTSAFYESFSTMKGAGVV